MAGKRAGKRKEPELEYHPPLSLEDFDLDNNFLMQDLLKEEERAGKLLTIPEPSVPEYSRSDMDSVIVTPAEKPDEKTLAHWHAQNQDDLKKRFLQEGLDHFADHNILELLLFFSFHSTETSALAHTLIDRFGSLSQVFQADYEQLLQVPGMSPNAAILLKMMPQVSRRYIEQLAPTDDLLNTAEKVGNFLIPHFLGRSEEAVFLLCLNNACKLLRCELISEGGLNQATFQVRKIAEIAFQYKSTNIILAHNHPTGQLRPSSQDVRITESLYSILKPIGIELLDHFIIAGQKYVSMMELGYLAIKSDHEDHLML